MCSGGPTCPRRCWPHPEQAPARARARRLLLVRAEKGGWFDDNDKPFELVDHTPQGSGVQSSEFIRAYNNSKPTKLAAYEYKPCLASSVPARKRLAAERTAAMEEAKSRSSPKPLPHPGNAAPGTPGTPTSTTALQSYSAGHYENRDGPSACLLRGGLAEGTSNAPSTCCSPASRSKAYGRDQFVCGICVVNVWKVHAVRSQMLLKCVPVWSIHSHHCRCPVS